MHIMIDLETMGNRPSAPIVTLGAVAFNGQGIAGEFYGDCALEDSVACGGVIDPDTVNWWLGQSERARMAMTSGHGTLKNLLGEFRVWYAGHEGLGVEGVWGNGAAFDNVILAETYKRVGQRPPWPFWLDRCYRTLKAGSPIEFVREGTHHNALDDARSQAAHLIAIWNSQVEM